MKKTLFKKKWNWTDTFVNFVLTVVVLIVASIISALIKQEDHSGSTAAIMIFVLAVLVIARETSGYIWGILSSFIAVIIVNYMFTYPYWELNFSLSGYPLIFLTMLIVSIITSATSTQIKEEEKLRIESEKERVQSNLLRSLSHDIRTPLTSIVGASSVLLTQDSQLDEKHKQELLRDIHEDGEWLIRVTENILSITRIGGDTSIVKTPELAEELIESSLIKFNKRNHDAVPVEVVLPDEALLVPMDIILMEQVLTNLLENAIIHGTGLSRIVIKLSVEDGVAVFSVSDDGCCIPESRIGTLFDGRIKSDDDSSHHGKRCMGIGLAVCKTIVNAHGGNISVRNLKNNSGVEFTFSLPMNTEA